MKKPTLPIVLGLVMGASGRDFRPVMQGEILPGEDGSVRQCQVFQTIPGVFYQVEASADLRNWTTEDEIYGLGHE